MKFLGARPQHEDLKLLVEDPDAVEGNLAEFDANGNPVDSGIDPDTKADKDSDAVENNLAKFDSSGNPVDSGLSTPNVSDAVTKKHTQNTDTGTTSQTFQLQTGSSGAKLKNNSGIIEIRNSADSAYANIRPYNIYPLGSTTTPLFTTADVSYFVNPSTGNDNNDGSSGSPFKTIAKAVSLIPQIVNHTVTINLADGNYSEGITLSGYMGKGMVYVLGNITNPENVVLSGKVMVQYCSCHMQVFGMETTWVGGGTHESAFTGQYNSGYIYFRHLIADAVDANNYGIYLLACPTVFVSSSTFSNKLYGIRASFCSRVFSSANVGTDNSVGLFASNATIMKNSTQPGGTTAETESQGGVIR